MLKKITEVILGALLYALGHPSIMTLTPIPLFAPLGIFFLFRNIHFKSVKKDLLILTVFCLTINLVGFYWIPQTIQTFGGLSFLVSLPMFFMFTFLVLPQTWLVYFSLNFLSKKKFISKIGPFLRVLFLAVIITLIEYYTPSQFPVHAGHPWLSWSWTLGLAPILGLAGYSFINYFLALSLNYFLRERKDKKRILPLSQALIILIIAILITPFTIKERSLSTKNLSHPLNIKVVQANIGNFMKVNSEIGQFSSIQEVFKRYLNLSLESDPADLIIWPETAYPYPFNSDVLKEAPNSLPALISDVLNRSNSQLLLGAYDHGALEESGNAFQSVYNSAMLLDSKKGFIDIYHKKKLIPFGETLPLGPLTPYIKDYVPGVSFFSEGTRNTTFETNAKHRFITPICYEILDPSLIRKMLNHSSLTKGHIDFIINLTNDSWYGLTAEPYQHLFLAKWRAVEFQRPIIRSTNSGITSVIDIDGKESMRLLPGEEKSLNITLNLPKRDATIYQKIGILSFLLLSIFLIILNYLLDLKVNPTFKRS